MNGTFIGIDGGGTRTTAVATDAQGRELARLQGSAGLVRSTEPTAGAAALADLTERVLRAAGLAPPATALCCALAGAGRNRDQLAIAAALQREAIAERVRVVTDADAAFHDAFANGPGILLIAGTGSIALGRNGGPLERTGGWGTVLGDEGSGYALGTAALRAAVRAHDGRGPATTLLPSILEHLTLASPDDLIHWCTSATKRDLASLAPLALDAAEAGDPMARDAAELATRELINHVATLERRLAPWPTPPAVALAGGLIAPGGPLRPRLVRALELHHATPRSLPRQHVEALQFAATPQFVRDSSAAPETGLDNGSLSGPGLAPRILVHPVDAARGAAALARES